MVVIRLARVGRKKLPLYRVVVADQRRAATGKFIDIIGHYNPHTKTIVLDKDKVGKWLKVGAQPSNTVAKLFQTDGVELPAWIKVKQKNKSVKNEEKALERSSKGEQQSSEETPRPDDASNDEVVDVSATSEASADGTTNEDVVIDASQDTVEESGVVDVASDAVDTKNDENNEDSDSSDNK